MLPRQNWLLYAAEIGSARSLPLAEQGLSCGFPSPATDYLEGVLDLNDLVVRDVNSTFFGRARGHSMEDAHIYAGDVLVIDRALTAVHGSIVLGMLDGQFLVKTLDLKSTPHRLLPAHPDYEPILLHPGVEFEIWGVVSYVIHKTRVG